MCIDISQARRMLTEMHNGICGGHYSTKTIGGKIA